MFANYLLVHALLMRTLTSHKRGNYLINIHDFKNFHGRPTPSFFLDPPLLMRNREHVFWPHIATQEGILLLESLVASFQKPYLFNFISNCLAKLFQWIKRRFFQCHFIRFVHRHRSSLSLQASQSLRQPLHMCSVCCFPIDHDTVSILRTAILFSVSGGKLVQRPLPSSSSV